MKDTRKEETIRFLSLFIVLWLAVILVAWLIGHGMKLEPHPSDLTQYGLVVQGTVFLSAIFAALLTYWRTQEIRRRNDLQQNSQVFDELSNAITMLAEPNLVAQTASLVRLEKIWDTAHKQRDVIAHALNGFAAENARSEAGSGIIIALTRAFCERLKTWQDDYFLHLLALRNYRAYIGFNELQVGVLTIDNCQFHRVSFTSCTIVEIELANTIEFKNVTFTQTEIRTINDNTEKFELQFKSCTGKIKFENKYLHVSKIEKISGIDDLRSHLQDD
jgi:hypothetical protein